METIKLEGISKKGRERIKCDGADGWTVKRVALRVTFSTEPGPWLMVARCNDDHTARWIHAHRDEDFKVVDDLQFLIEAELTSKGTFTKITVQRPETS